MSGSYTLCGRRVVFGSPLNSAHVALWDAINALVTASGGSASSTSTARQHAVARVEQAVADLHAELTAGGECP